jgi:putative heme iron utilization protein
MNDQVRHAHDNALRDDAGARARAWLLETVAATLCTSCSKPGLEGHPFGSVVPYALMGDGRPVLQIADIAAHTRNLRRDPRGSLFVRQPGVEGDPQTGWRLTVMGRWAKLTDADEIAEAHARLAERVPAVGGYERVHRFGYWKMVEVDEVRYIAGFGKIAWLGGDAILRDPGGEGIGAAAPGAVDHMNEDHAHNMVEMCKGLAGFEPQSAAMTALDRTGFLVRTTGPDRLVHFGFGREIRAQELRHAVVELLGRARGAA